MNRQVIEFSKYNPSGNMTILVHSKHDASEYASIANQLMAATHVCCEQVGFIESTQNDDGNDFQLVMSGNEFCGNATMSYIHHLQESHLLKDQQFKVKVSGCSDLVQCAIHDCQYYEVQMPQAHRVVPTTINMGNHSWKAIEIIYETYVHYVIPVKQVTTEIQHLVEAFVREQQWSHKYKTVGMMLFDEQRQFLQPLIYIPEIQSLIWENSCGSGTASIGVFNNYQRNDACKDFTVHQPGGSILVTSKRCHQLGYQTSIKGQVTTVATGKAYIE